MTYLVEILIPLVSGAGDALRGIKHELVERFGGVTAHNHAPAEGIWRDDGDAEKDDIIVIEVMTDTLDRDWWKKFRQRLEDILGQKEIVVRAKTVERL